MVKLTNEDKIKIAELFSKMLDENCESQLHYMRKDFMGREQTHYLVTLSIFNEDEWQKLQTPTTADSIQDDENEEDDSQSDI